MTKNGKAFILFFLENIDILLNCIQISIYCVLLIPKSGRRAKWCTVISSELKREEGCEKKRLT